MTDDDETPIVAPSRNGPSPSQALGNAVAISLSVLALVATVVVLLWVSSKGDLWPFSLPNTAIPPCLPDIDHHCIP